MTTMQRMIARATGLSRRTSGAATKNSRRARSAFQASASATA